MIRRIGFWTLLIASALWAQGCAHVDVPQQKTIQQQLIGTWSCRTEILSISMKSLMQFTETQLFAKHRIVFSSLKNTMIGQVANYTILNDKLPIISYEVTEEYRLDSKTPLDIPQSKRYYTAEINQLSDTSLTLQFTKMAGDERQVYPITQCQKIHSK